MLATREEKIAIGKRICNGEISRKEAEKEYNLPYRVIKDCVYQYEISIGARKPQSKSQAPNRVLNNERAAYENMTKEELINELILAKANELRAKKGYEVRGVGANKEFIPLNNENSK